MNRKSLLSLLIIDLAIIVMTAGLLYYRYTIITAPGQPSIPSTTNNTKPKQPPIAEPVPAQQPAAGTTATAPKHIVPPAEPPAANATAQPRKIAFSYRNSKVKMVQIIGDFNDWIPARMVRGADHKWTVTLTIKPGEYAYNFVVDGRPVRDPNNPKICDAGRGFANSYLKVKPIDQE